MNILVYANTMEAAKKKMDNLVRGYTNGRENVRVRYMSRDSVFLSDGTLYSAATQESTTKGIMWNKVYIEEASHIPEDYIVGSKQEIMYY